MDNLFSKVLWICLVWVAYASAEIWEATVDGLSYGLWFDTTARTITSGYKGEYQYDEEGCRLPVFSDLQMPQVTTGPWSFEYGLLSLDSGLESISMPPGSVFKSSNAVYFIKNKDLLDFSQPLPLPLQSDNYQLNYSATKSYEYDYVYLLGFGLLITGYGFEDGNEEYHEFHKEENFLFQTHSGYYALCHAALSSEGSGTPSLSGMVLTCAVQTDGSTRFDSLPSHPAPLSVRSRPVSRPSVLKNHRYTVDGSLLNDERRRVWQSLGE